MAVHDPELKRLRYLMFLNEKLMNRTNLEIALKYNVDTKTVERSLTWGKRNGIIADAEDHLLNSLMPKVQKVIEQALEDGDTTVAMKLYDKVVKGRDAKKGEGVVDEDELTKFIARRRAKQQQIEATVEGELSELPSITGQPADAGEISDETRADERRSDPIPPSEAPIGTIDGEIGADFNPNPSRDDG